MKPHGNATWTDKQRIQVMTLRARGWTYDAIGKALGKTKSSVISMVRRLSPIPTKKTKSGTRGFERRDLRNAQDRKCLCCGHSFKSEGKHHRVCDSCKQSEA